MDLAKAVERALNGRKELSREVTQRLKAHRLKEIKLEELVKELTKLLRIGDTLNEHMRVENEVFRS